MQASAGSFGGGAIAVTGGSVTLTYVTFATNTADSGGGLAATASAITISDCYFINNVAQASGTGRGGALLCELLLQPSPASASYLLHIIMTAAYSGQPPLRDADKYRA